MGLYLGDNEISSFTNINAQIEIIKNQFQDKRITWNGTPNVLLTTALIELQQTASGKANIVVANELPQTTTANTQYWIKTYNGQTLQNGRYILITDSLNVVNYVGTSDVDLSDYVKNTVKVGNNTLDADIAPASLFNDIKDLTGIFTNKTVDADNNTISNIEIDNFKADVVKEILSAICTNQQLPTAKAVWDAIYTAGLDYNTTNSYDAILTALNVPQNGSKGGYIVNFKPPYDAGATKQAGYLRGSLRNDNAAMIEFFPYDTGRRWWILRNSGTWGDWTDGSKYMHRIVKYNNTSFQAALGWIAIINEKKTMTYAEIAKWLYDNNHRDTDTAYDFAGGCTGTTAVRNSADTGTTYVGAVCSGGFSADGTTIKQKVNFNGSSTIATDKYKIFSVKLQQ